ncbi:hypothetical protein U1Q18_038037 [Sarracenia purpurea var. burkii]
MRIPMRLASRSSFRVIRLRFTAVESTHVVLGSTQAQGLGRLMLKLRVDESTPQGLGRLMLKFEVVASTPAPFESTPKTAGGTICLDVMV